MGKQQGNVLFLILIAVALFAALSYAVTRSTRGGGDTSSESAKIRASNIIQVAGYFDAAIDRFMIMNGYSLQDITFFKGDNWNYHNTPNYPDEQRLFDPDGGGETWPAPQEGKNWFITGSSGVPGFGVSTACTGANPCAELVMAIEVPLDVCLAINDIEGITNPSEAPPVDSGDFESIFYRASTTFTAGGHQFNAIGGHNDGKVMGCLETTQGYRGGPGVYFFYYVLMTDIWQ